MGFALRAALAARRGAGAEARWEQVLALHHHWAAVPDALKLRYAQMGALAWCVVG